MNEELQNDKYVLRRIFAFLDCEVERDTVYRVCRAWRTEYRWVNPRLAYAEALRASNETLANELWDFCGLDTAGLFYDSNINYGRTALFAALRLGSERHATRLVSVALRDLNASSLYCVPLWRPPPIAK